MAVPFLVPKDVQDVEKKVAAIAETTGAVRKGPESMAAISLVRQNAIKAAVMGVVGEIPEKLEKSLAVWVKDMRRASAGVGEDLTGLLTQCRGLSTWASGRLLDIERALKQRMALAKQRGSNSVVISPTELETLRELDALDGVEDEIVGSETKRSIERLTEILAGFEGDVARLNASSRELVKLQSAYRRFSLALAKAEDMIEKDGRLKRDAVAFKQAANEVEHLHLELQDALLSAVEIFRSGAAAN